MLDKINTILEKKEYRRIIENILSLFSLQGFNYILPLITFPYLTRVLGPEKYGLITFAMALISYFQMLTNFGFNFSASREIAINRNDDVKVSKIFSSVMTTKTILMVLSFIILTVVVFSFDKFRSNWVLYYLTFGLVLGNLTLPTWFFLGMEKMKYISILNMGIGLIYTVSIFIFVRNSADYLYVPLINSIGTLIIGLYSLRLVKKEFNVNFRLPSLTDIKYQIEDGKHLFMTTLATSLYSTSTRFILGLFVSSTILGYYSVAETIARSLQQLITPISQAIYPYFSKIQSEDRIKAKTQLKKLLILVGVFTFLISVLLVFCAPIIIEILAGPEYVASIPLLQVYVFVVFTVGMSSILGLQGLVAFGHQEKQSKIVMFAVVIHLILLACLISILGSLGAVIAVVITESIICTIEYIVLKRLQIL